MHNIRMYQNLFPFLSCPVKCSITPMSRCWIFPRSRLLRLLSLWREFAWRFQYFARKFDTAEQTSRGICICSWIMCRQSAYHTAVVCLKFSPLIFWASFYELAFLSSDDIEYQIIQLLYQLLFSRILSNFLHRNLTWRRMTMTMTMTISGKKMVNGTISQCCKPLAHKYLCDLGAWNNLRTLACQSKSSGRSRQQHK